MAEAGHPPARTNSDLRCGCNIREMTGKLQVKCAIAGCHLRQKVTLAQREELRRMGREYHATAGLVCPVHVKAAFNFEFDDIDVAVPLGGRLQHPAGLKTGHYMLCPVLAATGGTEAAVS